MKGLTLYIAIGRYGGFRVIKDGPSLRLILGWVAFGVMAVDLEVMLGRAAKLISTANAMVESINRMAERMSKEE